MLLLVSLLPMLPLEVVRVTEPRAVRRLPTESLVMSPDVVPVVEMVIVPPVALELIGLPNVIPPVLENQ